jgi:hypothetical protein
MMSGCRKIAVTYWCEREIGVPEFGKKWGLCEAHGLLETA